MATILVVDDHLESRDFLVTFLGYQGHRVLEATNGREALDVVRAERPHLVITDVLMPTIDGFEFVRQLRIDPAIAHTPVIYYSAGYQRWEAGILLEAGGIVHHLSKPSEPEVILHAVGKALVDSPLASPPISTEGYDREHLRLVTDKLYRKVDELEHEIVERQRSEEALRRSEEQLRLALGAARMGTWDWDIRTDSIEWSKDLVRLFGLEPGGFGGTFREFLELVHPEDRASVRETVDRSVQEEDAYADEFRVVWPDGSIHWLDGQGRVFRDPGARPTRIVGVCQDVTERKRAEQELTRAKEAAEEASRAKDRFLAILSHELRTPLTPVLLAVTMLQEDDETLSIRPTLETIRRCVELESHLIDDLLDMTRIARGQLLIKPKRADVHEVICQAIDNHRNEICEAGLQLELELDADEHHAQADPGRLQQVFGNLIKNAIKFTPSGGSLTIRTRNEVGSAPGLPEARLIVEVADTGIGIEPSLQPQIFQAFATGDDSMRRRYGGLGLGLAISRSIVEALGGRLTAASDGRYRGTVFTLELLTVSATAAEALVPAPTVVDGHPTQSLRILLVEDNKDTLRYLTMILGRRQHTVRPAADLATARELAAAEDFDLIVSDIQLPDGTGLELMSEIRRTRSTPGIAVSGFGSEDDRRLSRAAGFAAHLTKPVEVRALEEAIKGVIHGKDENQDHSARGERSLAPGNGPSSPGRGGLLD